MPIPQNDMILGALPPHLGDASRQGDLSPYLCSTKELCDRYAKSPARKEILTGFLALREELLNVGIKGFQWLDGSFLEDIETLERRDPRDLDVVTFVSEPTDTQSIDAVLSARLDLRNRSDAKAKYHVDHFLVPLCSKPQTLVSLVHYWYGLFSHRRDCTWKGMLRIDLRAVQDDDPARELLRDKS